MSRYIDVHDAQVGLSLKLGDGWSRPSLPKDHFPLPRPDWPLAAAAVVSVGDLHAGAEAAARKMVTAPMQPGKLQHAKSEYVVTCVENVLNPKLIKRWRKKLREMREDGASPPGLAATLAWHSTPFHGYVQGVVCLGAAVGGKGPGACEERHVVVVLWVVDATTPMCTT